MCQQQDIHKFQRYIHVILPEIRRLRYGKILHFTYSQIAERKETLLHSDFFEWLPHAYVSQAVMAIRRLTDRKYKKHDKVSLVILLQDLRNRPTLFSRKNYIEEEINEMPRDEVERKIAVDIARKADAEFTKMYGSGRHLDTTTVNADLSRITNSLQFKKIRDFANKNYAHTDEDRDEYPIPTYAEMNRCIDILADIFLKYYRLVMGSCYHIDLLDDQVRNDIESIFSIQ